MVHEFQKLAKAYTVLYVEDDPVVNRETKKLLEKLFKSVRTASDGEEGLALFRQYHDDLVITDIQMPKLTGLEMTKKIREFDQNVPIVIFSAYDDKENLFMAIEYGISQYVIKPLDIPTFMLSLKKVLIQLHLEKKLTRLNNRLWDILNTMDDLVISYKKDKVTVANRHFLDFFGIDAMKVLTDKRFDLNQALVKEKGYTFADSWESFLEKLRSEGEKVVKLYDKANTTYRKFLIRYNLLSSNADEYMLTLTDISHIAFAKSDKGEKGLTDPLTKVYNRTYMHKVLEQEILSANEGGQGFSIMVLDIDRFGEINTHFGYNVGDAVLSEFASLVKENIPESMTLGRWSGDIFMIVAGGFDVDEMDKIGVTIGHMIAEHRFETAGTLSCSLGVTGCRDEDTIDTLMLRTGRYIAKSKKNGGNRLETDRTLTPEEKEQELEKEKIVSVFRELIEEEEKVRLHNFYKGLPINGEAKLLYMGGCDNLAISLKQNQAFVLSHSKTAIFTHPKLSLPIQAKVISVSISEMVVTLSEFHYVKSSPIDRTAIRFDTQEYIEVTLSKGLNRISGQLIDISSRSVAFHTFSLGDFKIRDDVIVEFDLSLGEKKSAHYKSTAKVIMVSKEGDYFKIVVLIFHSKQSEAALQQYLAQKQLELTQEILEFSL